MNETADSFASDMAATAEDAATVLRLMANPSRLMLLCHLRDGESTVSELMARTGLAQAYVSQQLARLRAQGLVEGRKSGREVAYRLADARVRPVLESLYAAFCGKTRNA